MVPPLAAFQDGCTARYSNMRISDETRVLTKEDMIEIIKYLVQLINSNAEVDDIDHLSNRRVRTVGEQLYNQFERNG